MTNDSAYRRAAAAYDNAEPDWVRGNNNMTSCAACYADHHVDDDCPVCQAEAAQAVAEALFDMLTDR